MGIALHEMRIALLLDQFQQHAEGREQSLALAKMIAFLYAPFFLQARIASAAPRLDRDFYVRLVQYRDLHAVDTLRYRMTEKMIESHMRHLWYITEELVIFSLWDDEVPARERRAVADKLLQTDPPDEWRTGKPDMPQVLPDKPRLQDLVGSRSHLFFHNLRVGTNWLRRPVCSWRTDPEYVRIQTSEGLESCQ